MDQHGIPNVGYVEEGEEGGLVIRAGRHHQDQSIQLSA